MAISGLLNQTVSIKNASGTRDLHGKRALGTAFSVSARFERTYKTIVTEDREKEPIHGVVFVPTGTSVSVGDKIVYGTDEYRVINRLDHVGRNGSIHHIELLVQLWSYSS